MKAANKEVFLLQTNEIIFFGKKGKSQILINYSQAFDGKIKAIEMGKHIIIVPQKIENPIHAHGKIVCYARINFGLLCQD